MTGAPIWPIEERPVPQGTTVRGEAPWPTQPIPTNPPPFSRQTFTADDLNHYILTPEERDRFRERIRRARNDGPFTPIGFDDVIHMPGNQGGSKSMFELGGRQYLLVTASPADVGAVGPTGIVAFALPRSPSRPLP